MENFLDVRHLSISFHDKSVVQDVSFTIASGRTLALVGESGSGKSVTALSILRLLDERHVHYPNGEILLDGENLLAVPEKRLRQIRGKRISMIFQEPMTSLNPLHSVEKQIGETLAIHQGLRPEAARRRTLELLDLVGIPDPEQRLDSHPHQLSGGQKQRVMIAMALANEPDLLIADEPTTALDVTVQRQVLELLKSIQARMGLAILLITHHLSIVHRYADDVAIMQQGQIVEAGATKAVFDTPATDYTQMLLDADPGGAPPPCNSSPDPLLDVEAMNVRFPMTKGFMGRPKTWLHAVQDVSFDLRTGETLGIVGESGSGKTTLGMALLKLAEAQGRIRFNGKHVESLTQKQFRPLRRHLQIVFQDPFGSLSPRMSIADIVGEGLTVHAKDDTANHESRIIKALQDVGLDPATRHRYPHEFSGGQRQRVAIARALVLQPSLIVLDEPTSALDRTVQKQVIDLLRELQKRYGLSYLFISHDLAVVKALSHRVLVLKSGKVVEYGDAGQVLERPQSAYTQQLMEAAFFYQSGPA
jgi:microcin C transport system ATP-binding protein